MLNRRSASAFRPKRSNWRRRKQSAQSPPSLETYLQKRDFSGAAAILEVLLDCSSCDSGKERESELWLGYCYFHLRYFDRALGVYESILKSLPAPSTSTSADSIPHLDRLQRLSILLSVACCHFHLGQFTQCKETAISVDLEKMVVTPTTAEEIAALARLRNRLLMHSSDRLNDERDVELYHSRLTETIEDELSLAALHQSRRHTDEACEICKKQAVANSSYLALQVSVAQCYTLNDYSDISQNFLRQYLRKFPESVFARCLKATNHFKLGDQEKSIEELQRLKDEMQSSFSLQNPLVDHNLVVMQEGNQAWSILPDLVDVVIPQARVNLAISQLRIDDVEQACELVENKFDPQRMSSSEFTLQAVVFAMMAQKTGRQNYARRAKRVYKMVGSSDEEEDTVPGRLCMASFYFMERRFEKACLYLQSIEDYLDGSDSSDEFNWNYAIALAESGQYDQALLRFQKIRGEKLISSFNYFGWLARCHIRTRKPELAWALYVKLESSAALRDFLELIAGECYQVGQFWYAAKAYDVLERASPTETHLWEGKRASCVGAFQMIVAGQERKGRLRELIALLLQCPIQRPDVSEILRIMTQWGSKNRCSIGSLSIDHSDD